MIIPHDENVSVIVSGNDQVCIFYSPQNYRSGILLAVSLKLYFFKLQSYKFLLFHLNYVE